jgi:hypothetical protein
MKRSYYAIHDSDPEERGALEIPSYGLQDMNDLGFGIFWTVNEFNGPRRKESLVRINSWAVDLDSGTKLEQWKRIKKGLLPSLVVETKRGFHVYFNAKDGTPERWNEILSDRLVPYYQADENAKDLCRILRVPGYYHRKDPSEPFLVKTVFESQVSYREEDLLHFYPPAAAKRMERLEKADLFREAGGVGSSDFWERVYEMDCMLALSRLSGSPWVNYETYEFKRVSSGNFNIYVNGKGTSCWIDHDRRIGSHSCGGPSVSQWLRWYGHDYRTIYRILNDLFPELRKKVS